MGTTIRDVARAASVSIGTVSRALKNQPGLSETTRERVVEAARQLGYDAAQLRTRIVELLEPVDASAFFIEALKDASWQVRRTAIRLASGSWRELRTWPSGVHFKARQ